MEKVLEVFNYEVNFSEPDKTLSINKDYSEVECEIVTLTEDKAEFSINIINVNEINQLKAVLRSDDEKRVVDSIKSENQKILFSELKKNHSYSFNIEYKNKIIQTINFKTFGDNKKIELHYFINLLNNKSSLVKVKIFGRYKDTNTFSFKNTRNHTSVNRLNIVEESIMVSNIGSYAYNHKPDSYLNLKFSNSDGYFNVQYLSDKSYKKTYNHGCQGILTQKYFMCSGEQFLICPQFGYENSISLAFSLIHDINWETVSGYKKSSQNSLYLTKYYENLAPMNFYAYDKRVFNVHVKDIYGTNVKTVIEKSVLGNFSEMTFKIFNELCNVWGDTAKKDTYCVMVINDDRQIYAGEYSQGQGFSSTWGIGEMLVHQIYHRWNAWDYRLKWIDEDNRGLWIEGFNEFYCYKVLNSLGYNADNYMRGWNNQYRNDVRNGIDISILSDNNENGNAVYYKGAIVAYKLDSVIRERTKNKYSLDDVLKYMWSEWKTSGTSFNYTKMLKYIKTLVPGSINDWWTQYIINNKFIDIEEF